MNNFHQAIKHNSIQQSIHQNTLTNLTHKSKIKTNSQNKNQQYGLQYQQLTLKSLKKNIPVTRLHPYSSFVSTEKHNKSCLIEKQKQVYSNDNEHYQQQKTLNKVSKTQTDINVLKKQLFKSQQKLKSKTFYQSRPKINKSKSKWFTSQSFSHKNKLLHQPDEQQSMVSQYIKQLKGIKKTKKLKFQTLNNKITQQFPQYFHVSKLSSQSKINKINNIKNTNTNNTQLIKRKTFNVSQKYTELQCDQFYPPYVKYNQKNKLIDKNVSFCIYAKSKNRIMNTENPKIYQNQQKNEQSTQINMDDLKNKLTRQKIKIQSRNYYKKYLRNSFVEKKKHYKLK